LVCRVAAELALAMVNTLFPDRSGYLSDFKGISKRADPIGAAMRGQVIRPLPIIFRGF
jgi:hypothetical protein